MVLRATRPNKTQERASHLCCIGSKNRLASRIRISHQIRPRDRPKGSSTGATNQRARVRALRAGLTYGEVGREQVSMRARGSLRTTTRDQATARVSPRVSPPRTAARPTSLRSPRRAQTTLPTFPKGRGLTQGVKRGSCQKNPQSQELNGGRPPFRPQRAAARRNRRSQAEKMQAVKSEA